TRETGGPRSMAINDSVDRCQSGSTARGCPPCVIRVTFIDRPPLVCQRMQKWMNLPMARFDGSTKSTILPLKPSPSTQRSLKTNRRSAAPAPGRSH
uniref:Uncharacterized protein n=2 Tax=Ixodes scapularis TaxID=6945 RepID=A0A1S4M4J1_IXOSC